MWSLEVLYKASSSIKWLPFFLKRNASLLHSFIIYTLIPPPPSDFSFQKWKNRMCHCLAFSQVCGTKKIWLNSPSSLRLHYYIRWSFSSFLQMLLLLKLDPLCLRRILPQAYYGAFGCFEDRKCRRVSQIFSSFWFPVCTQGITELSEYLRFSSRF